MVYVMIELGDVLGILIFFNLVLVVLELDFEWICGIEFFMLNEFEFEFIMGMLVDIFDDIGKVIDVLLGVGIMNIIVILGLCGVMWVYVEGCKIIKVLVV